MVRPTTVAAVSGGAQPWAFMGGIGNFQENSLATQITSAKTGGDDWGQLTFFLQSAAASGTLVGAGHNTSANGRVTSRVLTANVNTYILTNGGGLLINTTVVGPFGDTVVDFMLTQHDHDGTNQVVTVWTSATGPHAMGSYLSASQISPNRYDVGARPNNGGPQERFQGFIPGHAMWNSGVAGQNLSAAEVLTIQGAFTGAGTLLQRIGATIAALRATVGAGGAKTKYAQIYTEGSVPLVGAVPTVEGTIVYRAI